jgi:hypothetical protein
VIAFQVSHWLLRFGQAVKRYSLALTRAQHSYPVWLNSQVEWDVGVARIVTRGLLFTKP